MTKEEFVALAQPCQSALYRVAAAYLRGAEDRADAAQSALLKAWMKRDTLRDVQFFKTWLTRILIRECVNLQRRHAPGVPIEDVELPAPPARDMALRDAIDRLKENLKIPVILYYLEGYSLQEVSQALRLPQGTIKSRLSRARDELRNALKEEIE